jgi:hypothetical protein
VGDQSDVTREGEGPADLTDVIVVAIIMAAYAADIAGLELALNDVGAAKRLGLDTEKTQAVMRDSAAEVTALSQALGN